MANTAALRKPALRRMGATGRTNGQKGTGVVRLARSEGLDAFRQMVDQMPINVLICDLDEFRITYANRSSVETLRRLQHLIPIKADEIVGTSIDVFHKNPAHQRRIVSDPANLPYKTTIKIGDEMLELLVTAQRDRAGEYRTAMLTWSIVTEKARADAESARLRQMVDQMPINVMLCDPKDFTITYLNQTSLDTLKGLEHLLPVKSSQLLGQCIDVFHKNPTHQRRLLADPNNLPHRARIRLGEESLDLRVSAIRSSSGDYIGPMLTWSVVTKQVRMADTFEKNVLGVVEIVSSASTELQSSAQGLAATSEETTRQSTAVAAASEEATRNVQTVAAAAEEMSRSIEEINRQVSESSRITTEAVAEAERTNASVQSLSAAAQKIGEVVDLINEIASQTHLLALNATIEAARAGDAGRGFAVVASEVKSLANQTAKATEEIASQISSMQHATGEAVTAIQSIGATISKVSTIAGAIAAAVQEQGAATQEIARNVQQAAQGTQDVSSNILSVTKAASESGQSSSGVLDAATELARQSETLKTEVDKFLSEIRAM